jgi:hypothetical protein
MCTHPLSSFAARRRCVGPDGAESPVGDLDG